MNNLDFAQSMQEISKIREYGNFSTIKNKLGETKLKNSLLSLYPNYTIKEIEYITGIADSTLARWFKCLSIPSNLRWHIKILSKAGSRNTEYLLKNGNTFAKRFTIQITPDLAYLIGFVLGDGAIQTYMVEAFNQNEGFHQYLRQIMKTYGSVTEDKRQNGLWRLRLSSVTIANLIKKNKEIDKETINFIFKNKKLARKFTAAFWDAEGTVRKQGNSYHIYLYNTNKYLLDKICGFLRDQKIEYSLLSRDDTGRNYKLNGRPVRATKILHRISIPTKSRLVWAKEIGVHMFHSKKSHSVKELMLSKSDNYE